MNDTTKNLADVILGSAQLLVITIGAVWALWRFRRERVHVPRVSFDLQCHFYGPHKNEFIAEFVLSVRNKGLVKHKFHDVRLRVRGITKEQDLDYWQDRGQRLAFPELLISDNVIYKQRYGHIFVEPGIDQDLTYITKISSSINFIVARAEFRYDGSRTYSIERVFVLPISTTPTKSIEDG